MMARTPRRINTRISPPDLILIITEGEKTEPNYFKQFKLSVRKVVKIKGTGTNTISLIKTAEREVEKAREWYHRKYGVKLKNKDIVVWCVFDRDSFPPHDFDNAIQSANSKGYNVAYSNEAFELWYLLHFAYHDAAISRNQYVEKLSAVLNAPYKKNDERMYEILTSRQKDAIRNAETLMQSYTKIHPSQDNPSITVQELVKYLNLFF